MSETLRIRLDRTMCDGFGICARHAPETFSLDDWGYATLIGDGTISQNDRHGVMRALLDCPVHAIATVGERRPRGGSAQHHEAHEAPEPHPKTDDNEAISEFVR